MNVLVFRIFLYIISICSNEITAVAKKPQGGKPTPACIIPSFKLWTEELKFVMQEQKPEQLDCTKNHPLLFKSNFILNTLAPEEGDIFESNGIKSCCYRKVSRRKENDYSFDLSPTCTNLSLEEPTHIPLQDGNEFIGIECLKQGEEKPSMMDFHAFPMESISRFMRENNQSLNYSMKDKKNVLVLILDSVGRMNFIRGMEHSYKFLIKELNAIEMKGHSRVGYDTYLNLLAHWTGLYYGEIANSCLPRKSKKTVDACPFIWKNFSKAGFLTGYSDDSEGPYTYPPFSGFAQPPTHFYPRPMTLAINKYIAKENRLVYYLCAGPRSWFRVLLETLQKMLAIKEYMPFPIFHTTLVGALGHDNIGYLNSGDGLLLSFLKWYRKSRYFENTVLLLLGDHGLGMRGELRYTRQGNMETNSPMLYFILAPNFKGQFRRAFRNLEGNRERLVTHFDLHETLLSLAQIDKLKDSEILRQERDLSASTKMPRGISLFLPIPLERTCKEAEIDPNFCPCLPTKIRIPSNSTLVKLAAEEIVSSINVAISDLIDAKNCSKLSLKRILSACISDSGNKNMEPGFTVRIETVPGNAHFEAVGRRNIADQVFKLDNIPYRTSPTDRSRKPCVEGARISLCNCER